LQRLRLVSPPPGAFGLAEAAIGRDSLLQAVVAASVQHTDTDFAAALHEHLPAARMAELVVKDIGLPEPATHWPAASVTKEELAAGAAPQAVPTGIRALQSMRTWAMVPQREAGGVVIPERFQGELTVVVLEANGVRAQGLSLPGLNAEVRCTLRLEASEQRTCPGRSPSAAQPDAKNPVWNQELRFLVQEPERAELQVLLESSASRWSPTWPAEGPRQPPCCLGGARLKLADLCLQGARESWIQLWADSSSSGSSGSSAEGHGQVRLLLHYQPFAHSEYELPQAHGLTGTSGSPDVGGGAKSCGTSQDDTIWDMQSAISASQEAAERRRVHLSQMGLQLLRHACNTGAGTQHGDAHTKGAGAHLAVHFYVAAVFLFI
ncbi:hypothetical protein CYMTET_31659, partial [Cymbomonas tetramitiformis]